MRNFEMSRTAVEWKDGEPGWNGFCKTDPEILRKAAVKLQSVFRGKQGRRKAFLRRQEVMESRAELFESIDRSDLKDRPERSITNRKLARTPSTGSAKQLGGMDAAQKARVSSYREARKCALSA